LHLKRIKAMRKEEVNIQMLTDTDEVHVGYSDENIVIIDSMQKFIEVDAAHMSMSTIAICLNGKVQAQMNGKDISLCRNQVAVIPPNTTVTDVMISPDFDMKAMFLNDGIIQGFLHEKMNVWNEMIYVHGLHVIDIDDEEMQFFNRFYEMLMMCFGKKSDSPYRQDVIQSLLRGAVLALCGVMRQIALPLDSARQASGQANSHFQRFLNLLHSEKRHRHRTVDSFAMELCITPKYLSALCKRQSGKTASEWITEQQLEDIRYYLRQTDMSIKQVSHLLDFPNTSFFGRYVKAHFGMTPGQIRQQSTALQ